MDRPAVLFRECFSPTSADHSLRRHRQRAAPALLRYDQGGRGMSGFRLIRISPKRPTLGAKRPFAVGHGVNSAGRTSFRLASDFAVSGRRRSVRSRSPLHPATNDRWPKGKLRGNRQPVSDGRESPFSLQCEFRHVVSECAGAMIGAADHLPEPGEKLAAEAEFIGDKIAVRCPPQREIRRPAPALPAFRRRRRA